MKIFNEHTQNYFSLDNLEYGHMLISDSGDMISKLMIILLFAHTKIEQTKFFENISILKDSLR